MLAVVLVVAAVVVVGAARVVVGRFLSPLPSRPSKHTQFLARSRKLLVSGLVHATPGTLGPHSSLGKAEGRAGGKKDEVEGWGLMGTLRPHSSLARAGGKGECTLLLYESK